MRWWRRLRENVSGSLLAALALGAGFLGFVAWDQSHWWRLKPDYRFGWLVPLLAGYIVHDRWPLICERARACAAEGSPRSRGLGRWLLAVTALLALLGGAMMFLLGSFYRASAGTSQPGTLAITLGAVAIVLPLLFFNAPDSPRPAPAAMWDDARVKLVACFVFPVLVWLISAPLVSAVESEINLVLLRVIVTVVASVFQVLGLMVEQHGNVLALEQGSVGVEEACSGIRSLTACVFAGSFLAAHFAERLGQKIALIVAAVVLGLVSNLGRSLFLTAWAYGHAGAISDTVHDAAGAAVLGLTVSGLLALVWRMKARPPAARPSAGAGAAPSRT